MTSPIITFLSDYGLDDDFVGVCHGVIAILCPQARVIDITHGVGRHDVRAGALILGEALPYMPVGIHLAVVDPGVGAERRAVAVRLADDRVLVGPDNGLLTRAIEAGGGAAEAVEIGTSRFRLEPASATFHGRDIFAPVAARLAGGAALADAGERCDPGTLVELELPRPYRDGEAIVAHALYVDRFGNIGLDLGHDDLAGSGLELGHRVGLTTRSGASHEAQFARTFADLEPGRLLVYEDAYRRLALAVSHGDASRRLGIAVDDEVWITPQ